MRVAAGKSARMMMVESRWSLGLRGASGVAAMKGGVFSVGKL